MYENPDRYGGEEFLVVLPGCDREMAAHLAERLRLCICGERMDIPEGMLTVSVSLGVATCGRESRCDAGSLVKSADRALYLAKKNGRNRVAFAEPPDQVQE